MADVKPRYRASSSSAKFNQMRGQVNEVKDIMSDNISKVVERGHRLDDLIGRTDGLQVYANVFQRKSTRVARKYWWENVKMKVIISVIVLIVLILIILFATNTAMVLLYFM